MEPRASITSDGPPASPSAVRSITLQRVDPSTGESLPAITTSDEAQALRAIEEAHAAFTRWRRMSSVDRAAALHRIARSVESDAERLATLNSRETGKLIGDARDSVAAAVAAIEQYAVAGPSHRGRNLNGAWNATDFMAHEPRGLVAVITPWNDPVAVAAGLLAAALVTGNAVVHKPSERSSHVGAALADHFVKALPPGVLGVVQGGPDVGALIAADSRVRLIAHVGSTAAGRSIAAAAAATGAKALLENGGNDALIVDADVDPYWAATQAATGAFTNAGQLCTSVERIFVLRERADAFVDALAEQALSRRTGNALDPNTRLGPLVDERHREQVHRQVIAAISAGAKPLVGGIIGDGPGAFYPATVLLDEACDSPIWHEETFGPVAPVRIVDDFATAIDLANRTAFGLAATVLTSSLEHVQRSWRELDVGTVKVNAVFGGAPAGSAQPRKASGSGFGYGPELLDEMTLTKVVHVSPRS